MKQFSLFLFAFAFLTFSAGAQNKSIHVRYNENSQRLIVMEPGYLVLSYDMYLYPANSHAVIGPCTYDYNNEDLEKLAMFYDRVHPGDKVWMRDIKVLNISTKRAERAPDYAITLR
jgi:hypothetical protein